MAYSFLALAKAAGFDSGAESSKTDDPPLGEEQSRIDAAIAQVERYAPDAPEAVRQEAIIRLLGYLNDAPTLTEWKEEATETGITKLRRTEQPDRQPNAFYHSGAAAALAPWRAHGAGIIEDAPASGAA